VKQKIIITSEEVRKRVLLIIESLPLEVAHEIEIREYKKDRSKDQNALYWKWLTVIGNELGETKEDVHERYKDKFLVHIYERDCPDYADMIQGLRAVWRHGMEKEALSLKKRVVELTSTSTATVKQMTEYLDSIEHDAASLAIRLPHPDD
jgi:hypothetical protein